MDALKRQLSWKHVALWAAALIPFAMSMIVLAGGNQARPVEKAPREALAFEQYLVNLGAPPPRAEYAGRFAFRNVGSHSLKVLELEPSCGCLSPRLDKKTFEPGEVGEFYLRVRAANEKPGLHEYTCKLKYDDGQPRETEVRFKITLPEERIEIRPRALAIYQFSEQPTMREISITDFRAMPEDRPLARLEITDAKCKLDWVQVVIAESQVDESGQRQQVLQVTVTKVPPGTHNTTIEIETNISEYAKLVVPLRIDGLADNSERLSRRTKSDDSSKR